MKLMTTEHKVDRFYVFAGFFIFEFSKLKLFEISKQ